MPPSSKGSTSSSALEFLEQLWRLNHALERLSGRMDRRFGITAQQRFLLRYVAQRSGVTPGELATSLHLDPGTISAALRRLERKKLLTRTRDVQDGRRVMVELTKAGRALNRPQRGTVENGVRRMIGSNDARSTASTKRMLVELAELLDDELAD